MWKLDIHLGDIDSPIVWELHGCGYDFESVEEVEAVCAGGKIIVL
jgi:hypothetical protein